MGYNDSGKRKRKTIYGTRKAEVQDKLRRLQTAAASGQLSEVGRLTIGEYLPRWLETKKPTVATHTHIAYERDCRLYLIPHLGGIHLAKISALHVEQLYADLTKAGVSASMQRKAGVTLRAALQHAVYPLKLIPHNPAADVPKPRHTPDEMTALDPEQVGRFLSAARGDRLYPLYVVALDSAAREGELFALTWGDVDWSGSAIAITKNLEETKGKLKVKDVKTTKSRRRIVMGKFTMEALAEHRKLMLAEGTYRPDGPVFCDTEGGYLRKSNVLRRSFRPILARAKLPPIRPYDLRHSSATLLLLEGVDSKIVSERLGHSSTRLTQDTYQHVLPGMQERAAAKLDAIFKNGYKLATNGEQAQTKPPEGNVGSAVG
jgi:integrase